MKNKYFKIIFVLFTVFCFMLSLHPVTTGELRPIQGNNKIYYGSEDINLTGLNDPLFAESEYSYNHSLALRSYHLCVSAFSSHKSDQHWGDDIFCGREDNLAQRFKEYGFSSSEFYGYDVSLNDSSSKAAFAVAKKQYNSSAVIVAIVIRGGNYGLEWADNFNIGSSSYDYHIGFYKAAEDIKKQTDAFINKNSKGKEIKLWISGYSRGGAVANILSAMYNDGKAEIPCQIYAYTFASPRTTVYNSTDSHNKRYSNIFNILSPYDPVYNIPPEKWGFGRFGTCVEFPDIKSSDKTAEDVNKTYYKYTGKILPLSGGSMVDFLNIIIKSAGTRDAFSKYLSVPISEFIIIKLARYMADDGTWQTYEPEAALYKMYGVRGVEVLNSAKNNDLFNSVKKFGIYIPEDFYILVTLCRLNGYNDFDEKLINGIKVSDLGNISSISSADLAATCHSPLFYRSWLENIAPDMLSFVKG